jgi:hypothetical protein
LGTISFQDSTYIHLKIDKLGEISILKTDIIRQTIASGSKIKSGYFWFENPQASRYFWAPNGYGLKKGEGYYQNIWVMFNQVHYGVSNHLSVGAGFIPIFLFGVGATPAWMTLKFSYPLVKDKVNFGSGALIGDVIGEPGSTFGILFGISTFGSIDKNISFGLGYGFAGGNFADKPIININGMYRLGPKGYILTENYFINADGKSIVILSIGGRRIIKRTSLDFGLFAPLNIMDQFIAIPWLGFTVPF